jgi:hypothetical protein
MPAGADSAKVDGFDDEVNASPYLYIRAVAPTAIKAEAKASSITCRADI